MKVSEFIEWLKTQDQEAIVEVVVHRSGSGYYDQGGNATTEEFTSELQFSEHSPQYGKHFEYNDHWKNRTDNKEEFKHLYGKSFLLLGVYNE